MFKNFLHTALRNLLRNRATALINIAGLSVGMTASVLVFLWVQNELNFDNYHLDADKIFRINTNLVKNNWVWESTPLLLADAIKKEVPEVETTVRLNDNNWPVFTVKGNPVYEKSCAYVDKEWFSIFNFD